MSRSIEPFPELPDRRARCRMHQLRREVGEGTEHVRALQQIGARQHESRLFTPEISVKKNVQVHGARRPLRSIARTAATRFDLAQTCDYARQRFGGLESHDKIDEVLALETDRPVAIP